MIQELLKQENEIREKMIALYNEFTGFWDLDEQDVREAHRKWLDMMEIANDIRRKRWTLEKTERLAKQNKKKETPKTFVNSYGEATTRNITSTTYERQQKKLNDYFLNRIK